MLHFIHAYKTTCHYPIFVLVEWACFLPAVGALCGRSAVQVFYDFMEAFKGEFLQYIVGASPVLVEC